MKSVRGVVDTEWAAAVKMPSTGSSSCNRRFLPLHALYDHVYTGECLASLIVSDVDGDGVEELLAGSMDGIMRVFKPVDFELNEWSTVSGLGSVSLISVVMLFLSPSREMMIFLELN